MPVKLENVQITSYQIGVLDGADTKDADSFVFQPPTQPNGGDTDGRDFLVWQRSMGDTGGANFGFADGSVRTLDTQEDPNLLLPATDPKLLLPYSDFDVV